MVVAEEIFQIVVRIKVFSAVVASFGAACVSETMHNVLHIRIVMQHPRRRNGVTLGCADESKSESQLYGLLFYNCGKVGMPAYASIIGRMDVFYKRGFVTHFGINHGEKACKLRYVMQQCSVYESLRYRQRFPFGNFVHQQIARLFAIVYRIVHLLVHKFVVLQQMMVRTFGEEQRRHVERVDKRPALDFIAQQIFHIMMYDVVTTYEIDILKERYSSPFVSRMILCSVPSQYSDVVDALILQPHFHINKGIARGVVRHFFL